MLDGTGVGEPGIYVGRGVGMKVGKRVGPKVGLEKVGVKVGTLVGLADGLGVGTPARYVGANVGIVVGGEITGALVGLKHPTCGEHFGIEGYTRHTWSTRTINVFEDTRHEEDVEVHVPSCASQTEHVAQLA